MTDIRRSIFQTIGYSAFLLSSDHDKPYLHSVRALATSRYSLLPHISFRYEKTFVFVGGTAVGRDSFGATRGTGGGAQVFV